MVKRIITACKRDSSGKIVAVCNPAEWWSPRDTEEVIRDIEENLYEYYVVVEAQAVNLTVAGGTTGGYLRTDPCITKENNIDTLPDC